jgi:hypothetical protein
MQISPWKGKRNLCVADDPYLPSYYRFGSASRKPLAGRYEGAPTNSIGYPRLGTFFIARID